LDDFGDETFREPLSRLLTSCANEARLNIFGKCALTQDILQLLTNCLQIQHDRRKWPRIADETIVAPMFIVGLPRTGTTLLHGLLAQDLDAAALRSVFSDDVDPAAIGRQMTKYWEDALEKLLDARKGSRSHAFFDVDYCGGGGSLVCCENRVPVTGYGVETF
jgi:Sulfotransferase family